MKIIKDIFGSFLDIRKVGFKDAMGGLFKHSTLPCWIKRHTICRWQGHDSDGVYCFKCWLYMKGE